MLKKFISDIAFIQLLNLLVKPLWILVIDREVQNQLSQYAYGEYFALFNFSLLFFIVLDLGISSFNATQLSKDPKKLKQLFGNLFGLKILLSALYLFLLFTVGYMMGYQSGSFELLIILAGIQIVSSFNQYFRSSITAFHWFKSDGIFMVLDRLIIIILCAIMLWGGIEGWGITIKRFAVAQLIGLVAVALILVTFIYYKLDKVKLSFSLKHVFPLLKKTWPFGLLIALMGLYNYMDGVMLEQLSGAEEAGLYAMGYRLFFALFMFAQIFSNVLLSMFGKNEKDRSMLKELSAFSAKILLLIGFAVALLSMSYKNEIMQWLYPMKYTEDSAVSFSILMFSFIGSALILVYGTLLTAKEKLKQLNFAAGATLILNLSLNFILIPNHGASGAAMATLISQLIFGISCLIISMVKLRFSIEWNTLMRFFVAFIALYTVIILAKQYMPNIYVHLLMITLAILIAALVTKVLNTKWLKSGIGK